MLENETDKKLAVHEAVCAERYGQICKSLSEGSLRMSKIEYLLYAVMVAVLIGPGAAAEFFKKIVGM